MPETAAEDAAEDAPVDEEAAVDPETSLEAADVEDYQRILETCQFIWQQSPARGKLLRLTEGPGARLDQRLDEV